MAVYYLKNSLNPDGPVVPVTVDINLIHDLTYDDGEGFWVLDFDTKVKDIDGDSIPTYTIHLRGSDIDIEEAIERGLAWIGGKVNWGTLQSDTASPYVDSYGPVQTTDVPIYAEVFFNIKDPLPSAGIDPSSITLMVNGTGVADQLEITSLSTITKVKWNPVRII